MNNRQYAAVLLLLAAALALLWFVMRAAESLPDFREYTAGQERKTAFFAYMQPLIEAENELVQRDREHLLRIAGLADPGWLDRRRVAALAAEYGLGDSALAGRELAERLLRRVDQVPVSLALAQAAKESGWGTSRFAREGNNLFGQWCYEKGCGIVPKARAKNATHEVERFASPQKSVRSYLRNINTHLSYREFRRERARLRLENKALSGMLLAGTLVKYSQRRETYVRELRQLIRSNKLEEKDNRDID